MGSSPSGIDKLSLPQLRDSIEQRLKALRDKEGLPTEFSEILDDLDTYHQSLNSREQAMQGALVDLVDDMSQTSETLCETGTRLDAILETAKDVGFVIAAKDTTNSIIEFSAGAEQIFGYAKEDVTGRGVDILCPDLDELPDGVPYACAFGSYPRSRVLLERSNGEMFPALFSAYPLKSRNGEVTASLIIVLDISKQEMTEKLLKESHGWYRALAMTSPVSIITFDADGVVTFVNDWHMRVLERGVAEQTQYIGKDVREIPCILRAGVGERLSPAFRGTPVSLEDAHIPAFGNRPESWHNIRVSPIKSGGEFVGGILILEDVTRRKLTELDLKQLIDSSPIPLLRVQRGEESGTISYLNPMAREMLGQDALGKPVDKFITVMPEEDAELSAMQGERCQVLAVDGPHQAIRASHRPSGESEVQALLDVGVLLEAKEAAEDASRAKSDFLANISHEIRTPLNALLGMLQLLEESDLGDEINELTEYAMGSAKSLLALLNDILDFSVIEARALALDENNFNLAEMIGLVVTPYRIEAAEKGIDLQCDIDAEIPGEIFGDARRLRQIVFHVLGNAVKFTDSGQVSLDIRLDGTVSPGERFPLTVTISDTGIGMSAKQMEHIFEPFRQADGSRTRRHGGTGIGLALVHEFVAAMNGTISVESQPGNGTRVSFTIPLKETEITPAIP